MFNLAHDELFKDTDETYHERPSEGLGGWWIGMTVLVVAAVAATAYLGYSRQKVATPVPAAPTPTEVLQPPAQPLGAAAEPIVLPPLDKSDPLVREMVKGIVSHPRAAAWLASTNLIR